MKFCSSFKDLIQMSSYMWCFLVSGSIWNGPPASPDVPYHFAHTVLSYMDLLCPALSRVTRCSLLFLFSTHPTWCFVDLFMHLLIRSIGEIEHVHKVSIQERLNVSGLFEINPVFTKMKTNYRYNMVWAILYHKEMGIILVFIGEGMERFCYCRSCG